MDLVNEKGEQLQSENSVKSIKASQRTRSHLIAPGNNQRQFENMEQLEESAKQIYAHAIDKFREEYIKEKEQGFDFNDPESVNNFDINYTPLGNTVLVKFIREEQKIGSIFVLDGTNSARKALVMVPGLYVDSLKRGDVVSIKSGRDQSTGRIIDAFPDSPIRIFNGISFNEIPFEYIGGVFIGREEIMNRLKEQK